MKQHSFEKFINKEKGSKKKEAIRQEKKRIKNEMRSRKYETGRSKQDSGDDIRHAGSERQKLISHTPKAPYRKQKIELGPRGQNSNFKSASPAARHQTSHEEMPLNKFIAHAGICGRREAAELVKQGNIKVNNAVVTEPGFKVKADDKITVNNRQIHLRRNLVYIVLNKPKDYITTLKDPQGRKTIFELIKNAPDERIFPVGRLDRNTTGVLLLTNDGELAQKLTHPSFEVKKIYEVKLDKPLQKKDMEAILHGIKLEDGFIAADAIGYADIKDKSTIGMEIHSGRNRIVRRMFEYLGYDVKNLDRVLFANLTKKNVERGKWRYLNEKEVRLLKYMNQSFIKKKN